MDEQGHGTPEGAEEFKAPETGYEQENNSSESIRQELNNVYQDNFLIVHQTAGDTAQRIVESGGYFQGLIGGTALMQSPDNIVRVLPELDKKGPREYGLTHKGADAMVIMAIPKDPIQQLVEKGVVQKIHAVATVDDVIASLVEHGDFTEYGLPNRFIYGYYNQGNLIRNPNFNNALPENLAEIVSSTYQPEAQPAEAEGSLQPVQPFHETSGPLPPPPPEQQIIP